MKRWVSLAVLGVIAVAAIPAWHAHNSGMDYGAAYDTWRAVYRLYMPVLVVGGLLGLATLGAAVTVTARRQAQAHIDAMERWRLWNEGHQAGREAAYKQVGDREKEAKTREQEAHKREETAKSREAAIESEIERRVGQRTEAAKERAQEATQAAQQAQAERDQAIQAAREAQAQAQDAEQRRKNAVGAVERKRRKQQRAAG